MNEQNNLDPIRVSAADFFRAMEDDCSQEATLPLSPKLLADLGIEPADNTGDVFRWKAELQHEIFGDTKVRVPIGTNGATSLTLGTRKPSGVVAAKLLLFPDTTDKGAWL